MVQYSGDALDGVLAALADPTRRAIVKRLAGGPARISDIAPAFRMSLTGFCKHVRVLESAGLVQRERRGRENTLTLSPEPLREVASWVSTYERLWNQRLDVLQRHFASKKKGHHGND